MRVGTASFFWAGERAGIPDWRLLSEEAWRPGWPPPNAGLGANGPHAVGGELGLDDAAHGFFSGALSRLGSLCNFENSARAGKHSAPGEMIAGPGGWRSGGWLLRS